MKYSVVKAEDLKEGDFVSLYDGADFEEVGRYAMYMGKDPHLYIFIFKPLHEVSNFLSRSGEPITYTRLLGKKDLTFARIDDPELIEMLKLKSTSMKFGI